MKKTLLILSALALSVPVSAIENHSFEGRKFISNGATSNIEVRFTSKNDVTLDTECYDANGKYSITHKGGDSYKIDFAIQSYTNLLENCNQSYSDKRTTISALHALNENKDLTFQLNKDHRATATMTGDNGSMITYMSR